MGGPLASLDELTASRVDTRLDVLGREFNLSISSAVSPIGPDDTLFTEFSLLDCGALRLAVDPESWLIIGEFKLLSLLEFKASFPTPPDDEVVASNALCKGFPLMSCNVKILGC